MHALVLSHASWGIPDACRRARLEPVFVGDLVSFYAQVCKVGRTSVQVKVCVNVQRKDDSDGEEIRVTEAEVTYVAVDENRRPVPVLPASQR